ncbi:MAG: hypothetical protein R3F17_06330 [Planctomycetota bacterium]
MNWLWLLFAIPFLAVGFFWLIGWRLPARTEGRASCEFPCDAETRWQALPRRAGLSGHRPLVQGPALGDGHGNWVEDMGHGEAITVRTVSAERPNPWCANCAKALPMHSRWTYRLTENGGRNDPEIEGVTIEDGTWHVPIFRVMMRAGGGVAKWPGDPPRHARRNLSKA